MQIHVAMSHVDILRGSWKSAARRLINCAQCFAYVGLCRQLEGLIAHDTGEHRWSKLAILATVDRRRPRAVYQCRFNVGAIDATAKAHSRNRPTATDEKKIFSIFVVISLVSTVSGKSLNCCHQMSDANSISAAPPPPDPAGGLGLQRSPQTP